MKTHQSEKPQWRTPELADRIADMMEDAGLTLADLLEDLPQIRKDLYREKYEKNSDDTISRPRRPANV